MTIYFMYSNLPCIDRLPKANFECLAIKALNTNRWHSSIQGLHVLTHTHSYTVSSVGSTVQYTETVPIPFTDTHHTHIHLAVAGGAQCSASLQGGKVCAEPRSNAPQSPHCEHLCIPKQQKQFRQK